LKKQINKKAQKGLVKLFNGIPGGIRTPGRRLRRAFSLGLLESYRMRNFSDLS